MKNLAVLCIVLIACSSHSSQKIDQSVRGSGSRLPRTFSSVPATFDVVHVNAAVDMADTAVLGWSSVLSPGGVLDTGLARSAAGVLEINDGTPGTLRDGLSRTYTVNTDGQPALFSTKSLGAFGNIWIGGGGQNFAGPGTLDNGKNTALGVAALNSVTTADSNTAIGFNAMIAATTAETNTAVGYDALKSCTSCVDSVAIGYLAGELVTTGTTNTTVGVESMTGCTTCTANAVFGISAGQGLTTGSNNTAIGASASASQTGTDNVAIGFEAGAGMTSPISDIAIGPFTLAASTGASGNIAIGSTSLHAVTTGSSNVAVGLFAGAGIATTSDSVAIGVDALQNGDGNDNTAVGALSLSSDTTGFANVCVGYSAGSTITTGAANTIVGYNSTSSITTGGGNTIIGWANATGITTGSFNSILGGSISGLAAGLSHNVILAEGSGTIVFQSDANHNVTLFPGAATATQLMVASVPSASAGTLDASANNSRGRITTVGATSTTLTFGNGGFSYVAHCTTQPEGSGILSTGIDVNPSATAPVFSCFTLATGVAAICPNFTYRCD